MSALVLAPIEEGLGMAERAEVGFTAEDRKILYQVEVRMQRLEKDVGDVRVEMRDGLTRIAKLEADRVGRKDVEDLLGVIEEKTEENAKLAQEQAAMAVRIEAIEKRMIDLDWLKKYAWLLIGLGLAVQFALSRLWK